VGLPPFCRPSTVLVPHRTTVAAPARRVLAILIIGLVTLANIINLALLLNELLKGHVQDGRELVISSVATWLTNAIAFGLWYWELDRGGPYERHQPSHREPDFSFPRWPHREQAGPTGH